MARGRKFRKKIAKKFKKLKNHFPALFLVKRDKIGREKEKKILVLNSIHTQPGQENSEKNSKKIEKIKKTSFRHYFLPKRNEIGREREKKKFQT